MFFHRKKPIVQIREQLEKDERRWQIEKELVERREALEKDKKAHKKKIHFSTSKWLIFFLFFNCSIIEIFTGWATIRMLSISLINGASIDFTPLVSLIGAVVGEVIAYAIYSLKSAKENTQGGIIYEMAIKDNQPPVG